MTQIQDPISTLEIAELLDVAKVTVRQWRARGLFPEPAATISGTPLWPKQQVVAWAKETGRWSG